jgi:hypothetical protein
LSALTIPMTQEGPLSWSAARSDLRIPRLV